MAVGSEKWAVVSYFSVEFFYFLASTKRGFFAEFMTFGNFFPPAFMLVFLGFLDDRKSCLSFSRELLRFLGRFIATGRSGFLRADCGRFVQFAIFNKRAGPSSAPIGDAIYSFGLNSFKIGCPSALRLVKEAE
jgi:hypothetical protein